MQRDLEQVRQRFTAALGDGMRGVEAADRLCSACVDILGVEGAALAISYDGITGRSFGASDALSRELEELQFTFGEGPYVDSIRARLPVLVEDLNVNGAQRWPAFAGAALKRGIRGVMAFPISPANMFLGSLDLYLRTVGGLDAFSTRCASMAAELAGLPLLDAMASDRGEALPGGSETTWGNSALARVEVYQAAGVVMSQLGVSSADAMVRLRGYAFAHDMTASDVAWSIIDRRIHLDNDRPGTGTGMDEEPE